MRSVQLNVPYDHEVLYSRGILGSISECQIAKKKILEKIEQYFAKNEKEKMSNLLAKLISMKYKGKGNIRELHYGNI